MSKLTEVLPNPVPPSWKLDFHRTIAGHELAHYIREDGFNLSVSYEVDKKRTYLHMSMSRKTETPSQLEITKAVDEMFPKLTYAKLKVFPQISDLHRHTVHVQMDLLAPD